MKAKKIIKMNGIFLLLVIAILILVINLTSISAYIPSVYNIQLSNENNDLDLISISIEMGFPPDESYAENPDYVLDLIGADNEILYSHGFSSKEIILVDPEAECFDEITGDFSGDKCPDFVAYNELESDFIMLNVPYSPGGERIEIKNRNDVRALSFDVSGVACGNDVCDLVETVSSCPQDCQEVQVELPPAQDNWFYVYVIFGAIIVVIVVLIMISRMGNKTPKQRQMDRLYSKTRRRV
ncbi:MAG: hypothetical protein ABIJ92_04710 [Candidatus Aenigmatarchaeota archaeon]